MKRLIAVAALATAFAVPAWASPAQDATIERLLVLTDAQKSADAAVADADSFIASDIEPMTQSAGVPTDRQKALKDCIEDYRKLVRESFSWKNLKPEYIRIYRETFTEEELKDLTKFYESPTGRMLVQKTPILDSRMTNLMDDRMRDMMNKMQTQILDIAK